MKKEAELIFVSTVTDRLNNWKTKNWLLHLAIWKSLGALIRAVLME